MIQLSDIIEAYLYGRDNNRKSPDQIEFELHWQAGCLRIYNAIANRTIQPTAYTFMSFDPCPREIFASDMDTRILHYYLDMRLRPLLEKTLSDHTWNNRIGKGTLACQNAVIEDIYEISHGYTRDAWIIKVDLQGCFPNISQDIAYEQFRELIEREYNGPDKDELLYILRACIFSYPTRHCTRKSPLWAWNNYDPNKSLFTKPDGIGAAIGHLIWQLAVAYYFDNMINKWLEKLEIKFEIYVDDLIIVSESKTVLLLLPEMRERFEALGAKMHPRKFYCQHYTHGVECLGRHIKMDRIYPNNRPIRKAIAKAHLFNRCIKASKIDVLQSALNSYLGICKNGQGYNQAKRIISQLDRRWFKFIQFNTKKVCIEPKIQYNKRNQIINKFNLL